MDVILFVILQFYFVSVLRWKKFTQVLPYVVCNQVRRRVHKQITKKKIRGRKFRTFCFWKTSFVHSWFGTYYALLLGWFCLKFLLDVCHCVYWVFVENWVSDLSHKIGNKFFIDHCQGWKLGSFVCEAVWLFSWVNTHPFDLKFVAFFPKFNVDSNEEFQEKNYLGKFFIIFLQTKAILYQNLWNFAVLSAISISVRIALKKIHTSNCLHPGLEASP